MAISDLTFKVTAGVVANATQLPQGSASTSTLQSIILTGGDANSSTTTYGTASGLGNLICCQDRTLSASSSETLDLYTGTDLKDMAGLTAAFRKLKVLVIWIVSGGDTSGLTIGNAASNANTLWFDAATDTWTIYPGGPAFMGGQPAGKTVDATHKNIKIANGGAVSVTYRIYAVGTDA